MSKKIVRLSTFGAVVVVCAIVASISYMTYTTILASSPRPTKTSSHATITIEQKQELFEPFLVTVQPGTVVTWKNNDTAPHMFTTTPTKNSFLNPSSFSFHVLPGQYATFTFKQPGIYHYYDTAMCTWNAVFSRVAPKKGVPHFPLAMEGIIWVQGPMNNLPLAAVNQIPASHDDFMTEFLAIKRYGTISWHNFDSDPHIFELVPGWSTPINPADIGLYRIAGTNDVPGGDTITISFSSPGLYYYACKNHTDIDTTTHRAMAMPMASEYPVAMEGFILVV